MFFFNFAYKLFLYLLSVNFLVKSNFLLIKRLQKINLTLIKIHFSLNKRRACGVPTKWKAIRNKQRTYFVSVGTRLKNSQ